MEKLGRGILDLIPNLFSHHPPSISCCSQRRNFSNKISLKIFPSTLFTVYSKQFFSSPFFIQFNKHFAGRIRKKETLHTKQRSNRTWTTKNGEIFSPSIKIKTFVRWDGRSKIKTKLVKIELKFRSDFCWIFLEIGLRGWIGLDVVIAGCLVSSRC